MTKDDKIAGETQGFNIRDVLVSRTDDRGVILAANEVFERISGYSWDELFNAPHKLIRHPDMPKGVFWFLWDTLKKGKTIGAFVKIVQNQGRITGSLPSLHHRGTAIFPCGSNPPQRSLQRLPANTRR